MLTTFWYLPLPLHPLPAGRPDWGRDLHINLMGMIVESFKRMPDAFYGCKPLTRKCMPDDHSYHFNIGVSPGDTQPPPPSPHLSCFVPPLGLAWGKSLFFKLCPSDWPKICVLGFSFLWYTNMLHIITSLYPVNLADKMLSREESGMETSHRHPIQGGVAVC